MLAYLDTSLLVKRYVPEAGSDELDQFLCETQPRVIASELTRLELACTLARKSREGLLTQHKLDTLQRQSDADFLSGTIAQVALDSRVLRRGLELMRDLKQAVATLDTIHLATALLHQVDLFMTCDRQLARAASEAGLTTWPK